MPLYTDGKSSSVGVPSRCPKSPFRIHQNYQQTQSLYSYCMKSNGHKSTELLRQKDHYERRYKEIAQLAQDRSQQLISLKDKIRQSKPILETALQKVQKKQLQLQQEISYKDRRLDNLEHLVKSNSKFHQMTVRIMQSKGMLSEYTGRDNYPTGSTKYTPGKTLEELLRSRGQRISREQRRSREDKGEFEPSQAPRPIKTQSAYDQYKQRLTKARGQNKNYANHNNSDIREKLAEVAKELKSGVDIIKRIRQDFKFVEKSTLSKKPKGSQSQTRIKRPGPQHDIEDRIGIGQVQKFHQNKQRRLQEYRNRL